MKNFELKKLEEVLFRCEQGGMEVINYGGSKEKAYGRGMLRVINEIRSLYPKDIKKFVGLSDYALYRQIRFFLWYFNQPHTVKVNIYDYMFNLLDYYICGLENHQHNLDKYYKEIFYMCHSVTRLEEFDIVAQDIVNLLNKE